MIGYCHAGPTVSRRRRIVQANPPVLSTRSMSKGTDILAEIHHYIGDTPTGGEVHDAVHGIFFADATKVQCHAWLREKNAAGSPLDLLQSHKLERSLDGTVL